MYLLCLFTSIVLASADCAPGGTCASSSSGTRLLQSKQEVDKVVRLPEEHLEDHLSLMEEEADVQAQLVANVTQTGGCACHPVYPYCRGPGQDGQSQVCYETAGGIFKSTSCCQIGAGCASSSYTLGTCTHSYFAGQVNPPTPSPTPYPTPYPTPNPTPTPTPNPTPNPTPMPTQHITLDFGNVKQNNLGGLGPDSGDAELRFGTVATLSDGTVVDLVVTTGSSYDPVQPKANGKKAEFGKINQASGGSYEYTFSFQEAATGESIKIDSFSMSFVDVDADAHKKVKETVSVCGASSLRMANSTDLQNSADDECYTIVPTSMDASENVQSLATMTETQKAHAFTATFSQTSTFTIKTIVSASPQELPQQRALVFAGVAIDF